MKQTIKSMTVGLGVGDVKEATRWYKALLGDDLEVIEPVPGTVEMRLTDSTWLQFDDTGFLKVGGSIVRFETQDLDAAHKLVKGLTTDIGDIEVAEGVISLFDFKDPSGNRLSFYQLA